MTKESIVIVKGVDFKKNQALFLKKEVKETVEVKLD